MNATLSVVAVQGRAFKVHPLPPTFVGLIDLELDGRCRSFRTPYFPTPQTLNRTTVNSGNLTESRNPGAGIEPRTLRSRALPYTIEPTAAPRNMAPNLMGLSSRMHTAQPTGLSTGNPYDCDLASIWFAPASPPPPLRQSGSPPFFRVTTNGNPYDCHLASIWFAPRPNPPPPRLCDNGRASPPETLTIVTLRQSGSPPSPTPPFV